MIPRVITDVSILFVAQGRPWTVAEDHPRFAEIRDLLLANTEDGEALARLADVTLAVESASGGRVHLSEEGLTLDGEAMPEAWAAKAASDPDSVKALLVRTGDRVRIEGDEDAEDGIYIVGEVDNADTDKRIYVEDEEGIAFFGFVDNRSIKEILP